MNFVIDNLDHCDRLALVTFNDASSVVLPLTPVTPEARPRMHEVCASMKADSGTSILRGLITGFEVLTSRQEVNDLTTMFLLSDGNDSHGNSAASIHALLEQQDARLRGVEYQIHSFGYGEGHDESVLCEVSRFKGSNFYFIRHLLKVEDCFIACLGTIFSIFARAVRVTLELQPDVSVEKLQSPEFVQPPANPLVLNIPSLAFDTEKHYMCRMRIAPLPQGQDDFLIARARLSYEVNGTQYAREADLRLQVVAGPEQVDPQVQDVEDNIAR